MAGALLFQGSAQGLIADILSPTRPNHEAVPAIRQSISLWQTQRYLGTANPCLSDLFVAKQLDLPTLVASTVDNLPKCIARRD
jgi:hypothetical protein